MSETPMTCKDYVWKVGPYVDGELPLDERDDVESHLGACSDCRELAENFRTLDRVAGGTEAPPVTGREWAAMLENVKNGSLPAGAAVDESSPEPASESEATVIQMKSESSSGGRDWLMPIVMSLAALLVIGVLIGKSFLGGEAGDGSPNSDPSSKDYAEGEEPNANKIIEGKTDSEKDEDKDKERGGL